jgi:glucose/arabinose dehydrogenase
MRHHYSHVLIALLLLIPLIIIVVITTNRVNNHPSPTIAQSAQPTATVIAKNLEVPWALDFLPDGNIIFTERAGKVSLLTVSTGQVTQVAQIAEVKSGGEGGLLGIVLHPQFATNHFVYVYYTYGNTGGNTLNRLVRYTLTNNQLTVPTTIVDAVPGNSTHDGGRIKFGPDGFLYIATGDGQQPSLAQDPNALAGKILRVTDTGQPAPGNPFNNRTYSYGHRNPQGLAWNGNILYETEHGNSNPSRSDEVNLIEPGKNYGWPTIEGDAQQEGMVTPLLHSGSDGTTTWAPSGTAFWNGALFFGALKGQGLYEVTVQGTTATLKTQHFKQEFGRIREAIVGPDNQLYITTSNRDGRGTPKAEDDKIMRISFGNQPQPSVPAIITPSFFPLAPCPTCVNPSISPSISGGVPNVTSVVPSTSITNIPQPTTDPCETSGASIAHGDKKSKHREHNGDVSGFMELLLRFLIELLNLILRLIGGGTIPTPIPTDPTSPTPNPCDTILVPPTEPQMTVIPSIVPSLGATSAPTSGVNPLPSITQPVSVPATVAPSQTLSCVPSGQKCDATGARKCCSNACVPNINPNFPNDPGTCD